jgi:transposase
MNDQHGNVNVAIERWIAFDIGKGEHHSTVLSADGGRLGASRIQADEAAISGWLERWHLPGRSAAVIDQPGSIGQLLLAAARRIGIPVAYVPGLVMRRAADLYPGQAKTDPHDSFVLADTARLHQPRLHWLDDVPDEALETLRVLCGYDDDLRSDANRAKNRLRDLLVAVCPPAERVLGSRLDHPAVHALLTRYPTPTMQRCAGRARLLRIVRPHAPRLADQLVNDLFAALAAQTLTVPAEDAQGRVISELATTISDLQQRRDALAADIEKLFTNHPLAPVLRSLPGIGTRTGARILAEIGDISRFPTSAHLASFAGLAPVTRRSGSSIRSETRSRRGNHRLKNALFLTAFCSLNHPPSRAYYDAKRATGKKHNAAVICLARRRCDVLHAMLRTATPYQTPVTHAEDAAA